MDKIYKIRLKKGDTVVIRSGKHKGKTGKITAVHPSLNKVTVEGVNIFKKHQKPTQAHPQGGVVEVHKPLWVSKVAVVEPTSKKASRIAFRIDKDGNKSRVYQKSGKEIK